MTLDHLHRLAALAVHEHLEEILMVFQPRLCVITAQCAPVDQVKEDLRAKSQPRLVKALVVGGLEHRVVESDIEPGDDRTGQRAGELVELLEHGREPLEVGVGRIAAEALDGEALERRTQAVDLVHTVKAQFGHSGTPVTFQADEPFLG